MKFVDRIKYAQDFFRFAYRIGLPLGHGLRLELPTPPGLVVFGKHRLAPEDFDISDDATRLCGVLLELLAYRLLAMELDSALEQKYNYKDRFSHPDPFVRNSSIVVHQIRNSVAHDILDPVWKIDRRIRDKKFLIPDFLEFDTTGLNGKPLGLIDFGGPIALFRLSEKWVPLLS
jgi:hypothetical protein